MAESNTPQQYGGFRFRVTIEVPGTSAEDAATINQAFVRISGVQSESEPMEYMQGTDTSISSAPGRTRFSDIEMERIYNGFDAFYGWRRAIELGQVLRGTVRIELLDLMNNPVRLMVCTGAWPKKWQMPELNATSSEAAIERITLSVSEVHEEAVDPPA